MAVALSLVLPAFNEAHRLLPHLVAARRHLALRYGCRYEILVVDDGSRDATAELVATTARDWPQLRLLRHARNRGKGAAVRTGVLAARGDRILFADADQATPVAEETRLAAALDAGAAIAIGVRHRAPRGWRRRWVGWVFTQLAERTLGLGVSDPQCGFKMCRAAVGQRLFRQTTETGYLFDLELLALARQWGKRVAEVPIAWAEQPGSKVRLLRDGARMAWELFRLRRRLTAPTARKPGAELVSLISSANLGR